jgi:hypothetical protein
VTATPAVTRDTYFVSFGLDKNDVIVTKEIEERRPALEANDEGRDKLATFKADDLGHVSVNWWDPSGGAIRWTISRDGSEIATVAGDSFDDQRPDPSRDSTYTIVGQREVSVDEHVLTEPFFTSIAVPGIDESPIGMTYGTKVKSGALNTDAVLSSIGVMRQQINTFIPSAVAETPANIQPCVQSWLGAGWGGYYAGDNRGYAGANEEYPSVRTGLDLQFSFDASGQFVDSYGTKRTSGTRLYRSDGTLVVKKDADLSGIKHTGDAGDYYSKKEIWTHSVGDPLCLGAPTIDYTLRFEAQGDGHYSLYGDHDQAPSYEYRIYTSSKGSWDNAYTFPDQGLLFLLPGAPPAHVDLVGLTN